MQLETEKVREFHVNNGYERDGAFFGAGSEATELMLRKIAEQATIDSRQLIDRATDLEKRGLIRTANSAVRMHLIVEEFGELMEAVANVNEVKALDAVVDLIYVLKGLAVTYGWPTEAAFDEVHRSNMTKQRVQRDPENLRGRDKGPNYKPPQLERLLRLHKHLCGLQTTDPQGHVEVNIECVCGNKDTVGFRADTYSLRTFCHLECTAECGQLMYPTGMMEQP